MAVAMVTAMATAAAMAIGALSPIARAFGGVPPVSKMGHWHVQVWFTK